MPVSGGFVNCTIDCNYAYSLPIRQCGVVKFDIWYVPHYFEWRVTCSSAAVIQVIGQAKIPALARVTVRDEGFSVVRAGFTPAFIKGNNSGFPGCLFNKLLSLYKC